MQSSKEDEVRGRVIKRCTEIGKRYFSILAYTSLGISEV